MVGIPVTVSFLKKLLCTREATTALASAFGACCVIRLPGLILEAHWGGRFRRYTQRLPASHAAIGIAWHPYTTAGAPLGPRLLNNN